MRALDTVPQVCPRGLGAGTDKVYNRTSAVQPYDVDTLRLSITLDTRSARRALRKLVDSGEVLTLGSGGPRDPYQYAIHPALMIAILQDNEEELDAYFFLFKKS